MASLQRAVCAPTQGSLEKAWDKLPVKRGAIDPGRHFPSVFLTATRCFGLIYVQKGSLSINRASERNEALVIAFCPSILLFLPQ